MRFTRLYLALSGLFLAGYGVYCLIYPARVGDITGLIMSSPAALTEIRAMYGGLELGLGLFFLLTAVLPETARQGLFCMLLCFGGLALSRGAGALLDGTLSDPYNGGALAYETISAVVALIALLMLNRNPHPGFR